MAGPDGCFHRFSPLRIGHAEHGHFGHLRVLHQGFLDLSRINVGRSGEDHVVLAVYQEEKPTFVKVADVSGVEPAPAQGLGRGPRVVPVTLHDHAASHQNLAGAARGQWLAGLVHHADFHVGARRPGGEQRRRLLQLRRHGPPAEGGDGHGGLSQSVELCQDGTEPGHGPAGVFHVHGGAAPGDGPQGGKVVAGADRLLGQSLDLSGGQEGNEGDLPAGDLLKHPSRAEAHRIVKNVGDAAGHQGKCVEAAAVRERRSVKRHVGLVGDVVVGEETHDHGQQVSVGEHGSLGLAGGAGSVEEPGQSVLVKLDIVQEFGTLRQQILVAQGVVGSGLAGADPVAHRGALAGLWNPGVEKVAVDHGGGPALLQNVANLTRMEPEVERDRHCPQAKESKQGLQKRRRIVLEDGDPVA